MPATSTVKRNSKSDTPIQSSPKAQEKTEEKRKTLISKKMPSEIVPSTTPLPDYPILWWTDIPAAEQAYLQTDDCGLPYTCTWTQDRSLIDQTTVLVFAGSVLDPSDTLPPTPRNTSQAWVLYAVPPFSAIQNPEMDEVLPSLGLTHAWSNSAQADFIVDTFLDQEAPLATTTTIATSTLDARDGASLAEIRSVADDDGGQRVTGIGAWPVSVGTEQDENDEKIKRTDSAASGPIRSILEEVVKAPWVDLAEKNRMRKLNKEQGGKAAVAWIVRKELGADCSVPSKSGRENYVKELLKVMDVDIYGDCMSNTAWPLHQDTQLPYTEQEVIADYKFYLALESANCQDYVTNSLVQALAVGTVPIVDGPKNYDRFSPSGTALIRVDSFLAPELMATELNALDQEDADYLARLGYRALKVTNVIMPPQTALSSLFVDTFKFAFSGSPITATVDTKKAVYRHDRNGAHCGICQLAHDLAISQYDWSSLATASVTNRVGVCERKPRYLPGLPGQMQAYEEYVQKEQEYHALPTLSPPDIALDSSMTPSIPIDANNSHSVNVTVSLLKNDTNTEWIDPTVHIEQNNKPPPQSTSLTQQEQLSIEALSSKDGVPTSTPPASEMVYLALLILVLVLGVGALLLATSKEARRIATWPFRHLFYKKVPMHDRREAQRRQQMSLERIMLSELGEDLLYE
ncbi:Alpha-(1,3)-fucosyltransferase 11 [Podila clonocystis]|nr:Alpha-(1,3)-fucosyltransferase 11 [Podila clonocystis]